MPSPLTHSAPSIVHIALVLMRARAIPQRHAPVFARDPYPRPCVSSSPPPTILAYPPPPPPSSTPLPPMPRPPSPPSPPTSPPPPPPPPPPPHAAPPRLLQVDVRGEHRSHTRRPPRPGRRCRIRIRIRILAHWPALPSPGVTPPSTLGCCMSGIGRGASRTTCDAEDRQGGDAAADAPPSSTLHSFPASLRPSACAFLSGDMPCLCARAQRHSQSRPGHLGSPTTQPRCTSSALRAFCTPQSPCAPHLRAYLCARPPSATGSSAHKIAAHATNVGAKMRAPAFSALATTLPDRRAPSFPSK
ncbi:hypothetical protein HETIRDRAFT_108265 [Heterobasidion irregulare TC 32-1]|uniref:Uncharacterized protein n=1 Tax=Heterobasidion irregulare (strain TC 32-1) TaxID=747525 RepID=W4JPU0_HETIT|nr:uncharacterized protein HETIRDRAFT_108265 [Heterobasidion irregulare TC 32-1]ETW75100.1 hypothetical protein HETIRDRAFT_108265 [Heterobasidion irregulare TC 32-1]